MAEWDDTDAWDIDGYAKLKKVKDKKTGKSNYQLGLNGFTFKNLDFAGAGIEQKTPKGHIKEYSAHWVSENGKWLHIFFNGTNKVTEVVSDENEWNPDADENARNMNKKFGKRTNKAEFNKQRDLLRKAHNPRLYKELVNQSLTKFNTDKYSNLRQYMVNSDPYELSQKAIGTWEAMTNKDMTDRGETKMYDFCKSLRKAIDDKKSYLHSYVTLEEDGAVLDANDVLALIFA